MLGALFTTLMLRTLYKGVKTVYRNDILHKPSGKVLQFTPVLMMDG